MAYPFRLLGKLIRKDGPRRKRHTSALEAWALNEMKVIHIKESDAISKLKVERIKLECEYKDGRAQLENEQALLEVKLAKLEHEFQASAASKDIEISTQELTVEDLQSQMDLADNELMEGPREDVVTPLVGVAAFVGLGYALGVHTDAVGYALHDTAVRGLRTALWALNGV